MQCSQEQYKIVWIKSKYIYLSFKGEMSKSLEPVIEEWVKLIYFHLHCAYGFYI